MSRSFMLAGTPVPDGRPKFARMGKFTRVYMPKKVTDYRTKLKVAYLKVYPRRPPLDGAISIAIKVAMPRPLSHFGTGRNAGIIKDRFKYVHHVQKPDCDNFAKMVLDALNGVAYLDDSQCIKLSVHKYWSHGELNEGAIFIEINEIEY